ncbi:MAG TPA: transketolase family protein [Aquifex aeolicus]|uniref:Transketolase family protein n=1 Tax=Aquifex aeolicus TaxID=63363 RepID=A0A9D1CEF0_AQUAO|nr:transketolase family protein [Aquificales bacterium]HIP97810.1 transketolase family protein [Aquifex aeolicus]HIQ26372.1 transketolase family protein [Aquifex aeolicus]
MFLYTKDAPKGDLRKIYGETLVELGKKDPKLCVVDGDLSTSTKTAVFGKEFPERFFNVGIDEQNLIGVASGLAYDKDRVVFASSFSIFLTGRPWEVIRQHIGYNELPVKLVATHAGITVGPDGASHQMNEDIAIMRAIPNMRVVVPADSNILKKMLYKAYETPGPFYIRLSREKFPIVYPEDVEFEIGGGFLLREGRDVTIVAVGLMVSHALDTATILEEKYGISAEVIDPVSVKPIDVNLLAESAKKTSKVVTVEEHSIIGGLGEAVASALAESYPVPIKRIGIPDTYGESGTAGELLRKFELMPDQLAERIYNWLKTF